MSILMVIIATMFGLLLGILLCEEVYDLWDLIRDKKRERTYQRGTRHRGGYTMNDPWEWRAVLASLADDVARIEANRPAATERDLTVVG